jgi:hypothetical protein
MGIIIKEFFALFHLECFQNYFTNLIISIYTRDIRTKIGKMTNLGVFTDFFDLYQLTYRPAQACHSSLNHENVMNFKMSYYASWISVSVIHFQFHYNHENHENCLITEKVQEKR